jgi:signal transduction histidine kinase
LPSVRQLFRRVAPRSLQARLTLAAVGVVALTLTIVGIVVVNRMDDYFFQQTQVDLEARVTTVQAVISAAIDQAAGDDLVLSPTNEVNPTVGQALLVTNRQLLADQLAQANVRVTLGQATRDSADHLTLVPAPAGQFDIARVAPPKPGQAPDPITTTPRPVVEHPGTIREYAFEVTLSDPYTFRASAVANVVGLLAVVGIVALGLAVIVAAVAAQRFTAPLRRLTDASRAIAGGDYTSRVPANLALTGASEIAELSRQFNVMAAQLGESVDIIRRDRDRSRDFLADVSHELRTPIAAMRTFNELLREGAADDPDARAEFLESSRQQLERLDWLAQNLLDLSKLDSGLVLLDLRRDDLRACVESAVEHAQPAANRRQVGLSLVLPPTPLLIRHDPQRVGQVVTNLVGNALKFTGRGGRVEVAVRPHRDGAQIAVSDTGVGIDASELPRIFDRFYRGSSSSSNEARGSGSGLGLAIVKSIVDMHGGRVAVESLVGRGATFTVTLLADASRVPPADDHPRAASEPAASEPAVAVPVSTEPVAPAAVKVADSSPSHASGLNHRPSA